ncbi:MAG: hypothetical protein ACLFTR_00110 [Candidatus Woesearchaeota archaeon]
MDNREIRDKLSEGYIHFTAIIEVLGKPKEHVEKALNDYLSKIKESKLIFIKEETSEAKEVEDSMFSTFSEVELMAKGTDALINFCFDYMPSSIEVVEPSILKYSSKALTDFLNDLQTRLHNLDMMVKTTKSKNQALNRNTENLLKNSIKLAVTSGYETVGSISKVLGISEKNLENITDTLVQSGSLKKDGEKLRLK